MSRITESAIEQLAIERLEALGYQYVYGPAIAVEGEVPERQSYPDNPGTEEYTISVDRILSQPELLTEIFNKQ